MKLIKIKGTVSCYFHNVLSLLHRTSERDFELVFGNAQKKQTSMKLHKEISKRGTEANKARYINMKNWAKKMLVKAMKEAAEWELGELSEHPNKVSMKINEKGWERC